MSYLLETLGRGLLGRLLNAFDQHLGLSPNDDVEGLLERRRDAPTSFDLAVRLGAAYLREDRLGQSRTAFEQARKLDGPQHLASIGLACVYDELGRADLAVTHLREALAATPLDSAVSFSIGLCLEQQDDADQAIEFYERSLESCPELRNGHERIAAIAIQRNDWRVALDRYARLADLEPGDLDVLLAQASLHLQCGEAEQAIDLFQRALLIEPDTADDAAEFGADIGSETQLHESIAACARLVEEHPGVSEFRVQLADLYAKADDDQHAVAQYLAALDLHPTFLEATVKLGTQHLRRQRYDDAAQTYAKATELNDRLLTAFVGLGVAQDAAGRQAESQATFDLAVSLAPNSTLLFSQSNQLHLKSARRSDDDGLAICRDQFDEQPRDTLLDEALHRHQRVLLNHPQRADLHYRLGMLYRQTNELRHAVSAFRQALAISPAYFKAWIKLGVSLREMGRADEALDAFHMALQVDKKQIDTHYQTALLYSQYNRFQSALDRYEAQLAGKPGGAEFRHNLLLTLQNVGMLDRADAAWRTICELTHDANIVLGCDRITVNRDD